MSRFLMAFVLAAFASAGCGEGADPAEGNPALAPAVSGRVIRWPTSPYDLRDPTQAQLIQAREEYLRIEKFVNEYRKTTAERGRPGTDEHTEWVIRRVAWKATWCGTLSRAGIERLAYIIADGADLAGDRLRFFIIWYGSRNALGLYGHDAYAYFDTRLWPDMDWRARMLEEWEQWKLAQPMDYWRGRREVLHLNLGMSEPAKEAYRNKVSRFSDAR